jgi:hypothetical protein
VILFLFLALIWVGYIASNVRTKRARRDDPAEILVLHVLCPKLWIRSHHCRPFDRRSGPFRSIGLLSNAALPQIQVLYLSICMLGIVRHFPDVCIIFPHPREPYIRPVTYKKLCMLSACLLSSDPCVWETCVLSDSMSHSGLPPKTPSYINIPVILESRRFLRIGAGFVHR